MDSETILTDVLIIGGGGAGLRAAIEAERYGAHATLVSKIKAGTNNSTALAAGVTTYSYEEFIDELFRLVVIEGGFLNDQRLVEVFVKDAAWRIPELRSFGVTLKLLEKERLAYFNPRNPVPLFIVSRTPETRNLGLTQPLRATAEGLGAKILDDVLVTKLLTDGKAVVGATALKMKEDKLLVISAKSTILANGGGDQALLRPDVESPFGFGRRATGDGYSLAYHAGAELMDMEFVTFNMKGHKQEKISTENYVEFVENATKGIERNNARWDFDPISPHYFYGGVRIDEWGKTSLDNLYAAGEVAGGVFGAGRMGGSALADIIVFGARAGESAAQNAKNTEQVHPEKGQVNEEKHRLQALLEQKIGSISPAEFKEEIRSITWNYAAIAKTKELLEEGLDQLKAIEEKKSMLHAKKSELSDAIEALNMLDVARMVMMPALMRTESRGSHWRVDYPSPDNKNWLKNIFIIKDKDMILTTRPVVTTRLNAPNEVRLGVGCWSGYFKITPAS